MNVSNPKISFYLAFRSLYFPNENTVFSEPSLILVNFASVHLLGGVGKYFRIKLDVHDDPFLIFFILNIEFSVSCHLLALRLNH